MQIFNIYIFISGIHYVKPYLLQNQNKKICANCKFFISNENKCSKFGVIDIITGKFNYEEAIIVRKDEEKCGDDAIFFKKNYFTFISITFDYLLNNNSSIFLFFYFSFFIIIYILINNSYI